jgi:sigma-B regulation protein RsbU (phosphoserine phosphatase)
VGRAARPVAGPRTARVVRELERIGREPLDRLCDELLAGLRRPIEDDVALLAVRVPMRSSG